MSPRLRLLRPRPLLLCGLLALGCKGDDCPPSDLAYSCGFQCSTARLLDGNPHQSGILALDHYFQSVLDVSKEAGAAASSLKEARQGLALLLGLSNAATPDELNDALSEKLGIDAASGAPFVFRHPASTIDLGVVAKAVVDCDFSTDPQRFEISCSAPCLSTHASGEGGGGGTSASCSAEELRLCSGVAEFEASPECAAWGQFQGYKTARAPQETPELDPTFEEALDPGDSASIERAAQAKFVGEKLATLRSLTARAARLAALGELLQTSSETLRTGYQEASEETGLKQSIGIACAVDQWKHVDPLLNEPLTTLENEVQASKMLLDAWTQTEL